MEYISTHSKTLEIIRAHNFKVKKGYGQNFLIDQHVINKIITGANIDEHDLVIEIGPGLGGLTERLAKEAKHLIAIEIDKSLIPILEESFCEYPNVEILNQDILKTDIAEIITANRAKRTKVVANLPYYITTPIIMSILEGNAPIESMTIMIQKEVGQRIKAAAGTKDYGALTLGVAYRANAEIIANVPRNSFVPRPNVDSIVLRLDRLKTPPVKVKCENLLFKIIRAAFEQRRKTLLNCLFNLLDLGLSKDELAIIFDGCGLDANVRGEDLTLERFADITNAVKERINR